MEQSRKFLKIYSYLILAFAAFSFLQAVAEVIFTDYDPAALPEGFTVNILIFAKIFILVISLLLILPSLYVGFKGLKVAKTPNSSKGHIVWATILMVLYVIALIDPVYDIVNKVEVGENISRFFSILLEAWIYFDFIRYAKAVAKEATTDKL